MSNGIHVHRAPLELRSAKAYTNPKTCPHAADLQNSSQDRKGMRQHIPTPRSPRTCTDGLPRKFCPRQQEHAKAHHLQTHMQPPRLCGWPPPQTFPQAARARDSTLFTHPHAAPAPVRMASNANSTSRLQGHARAHPNPRQAPRLCEWPARSQWPPPRRRRPAGARSWTWCR